jgi:hypothetical protein
MTQGKLRLEPRIQNPDPLFKALAYLHKGLDPEESLKVDSKLLFLLINHIGDEEVIMEAIEHVRVSLPETVP